MGIVLLLFRWRLARRPDVRRPTTHARGFSVARLPWRVRRDAYRVVRARRHAR
jgi:hypothetical protein